MAEILQNLPLTFIPIFVAMDPFGQLPMFTSLTSEMSAKDKGNVIRLSTLTALIVSIAFVFIGQGIFRVLGITVSDFKIAGGILLLCIAIMELLGQGERQKVPQEIGVVPIGVPMLVGPAVLTIAIVLIDNFGITATILSLVLNLIIVFIVFSSEQKITKLIGKNGLIGMSKVVMLLLAAIAVMMIRLGLESYFGMPA